MGGKGETSSVWGANLTVGVVLMGSGRGFGASAFRSPSNCKSLKVTKIVGVEGVHNIVVLA